MAEARDTAGFDSAGFDSAEPDRLRAELAVCLAADDWVAALLAGRPYGSLTALEAAARAAARRLSAAGLASALAAHPRIGERSASVDAAAEHSRREQAGLGQDGSTMQRLRRANAAYEKRFGHVFLIRAAGRTAEDILQAAEERCGNTPGTEAEVVREQLGEIAVLRLRDLVQRLDVSEQPP